MENPIFHFSQTFKDGLDLHGLDTQLNSVYDRKKTSILPDLFVRSGTGFFLKDTNLYPVKIQHIV